MSKRDNNMRAYDLGRMYPTSPTCPERTYEKSACKKLTCSSLRLIFAISDHASPQHANSEMDTERRRSCVLPARGGAQPPSKARLWVCWMGCGGACGAWGSRPSPLWAGGPTLRQVCSKPRRNRAAPRASRRNYVTDDLRTRGAPQHVHLGAKGSLRPTLMGWASMARAWLPHP